MAKRSKGRRVNASNATKGARPYVSMYDKRFDERWLHQVSMLEPKKGSRLIDLADLEDRRRFDPSTRRLQMAPVKRLQEMKGVDLLGNLIRPRYRTAVIVPQGHRLAKLSRNKVPLSEALRPYYSFGPMSHHVVVCVRRHRRRQVIFALGKAGSGKRRQRSPRYNDMSYVRC